ncbi:MAG TPA: thermonuclease family protein [Pyrinomonadaceae bacterium]|jgi:endonuclease YncB( thermonuclease family)
MKTPSVIRVLLLVCTLMFGAAVARAATLQAKVTEVQSGNTVVVSNINRSLKIRLKAIAPPEGGQPFSDLAREHLKALVMDKVVFVDYTDVSGGYVDAKVSLNGVDIGSQMLRDGVAWYDHSGDYALSVADRELYARCEEAARNEKRGLWSDSTPTAPWEFRKARQAEAAKPPAPASFSAYRALAKSSAARKTLSNKYLGRGDVAPGAIAGSPNIKQLAPKAAPEDWINYQSDSPRFSIRVPGNSFLYEYPILDGDLKIVKFTYILGNSDGALYTVMWVRGANDNATDAIVADSTIQGLIEGINYYFQTKNLGYTASFSSGRAIRLGSYNGRQYSVSAGMLRGFARVVSRQIGDQREMFALAVFSSPGDDSGFNFLNSLKIAEARK